MGRVRRTLNALLQILQMVVLALIAIALVLLLIRALPWSLTWDLWVVLTAIGTVGATLVALILAFRSWSQEKDATARFVSAWVTDDYRPRADGSSYNRDVQLHIANESNEPAFNAMVSVHIGRSPTPLGPLSAPTPISVIPPRRELIFDISIPLLAHDDSWYPKATLTFLDAKGRRWIRELNGELRDVSRSGLRWSRRSGPVDERQLGIMGHPFNPMSISLEFLSRLREDPIDLGELSALLAPEATGWTGEDWSELQTELDQYQPTSMVDYPAPRIARIKLSGDKALEGKKVEGAGRSLELDSYIFMTLTLDPREGWRVFGIGKHVPPDAIFFGGSLTNDVEPRHDGTIVSKGEGID